MLIRSAIPPSSHRLAGSLRGHGVSIASVMVVVLVFYGSVALAPSSRADPAAGFGDGLASRRSQTSCQPLRHNPIVEQAAEVINRSSDRYISQQATHVPITDPIPGLKDLGYTAKKAKLLQGAAKNDADAVKGALLEADAYGVVPDCSYTDFGVSLRRNEASGYSLVTSVMAAA